MRAGELRHRVTLQKKPDDIDQNSFGEEDFDYEDVDTVWAAVEPLRGREFIELRRAGAEVTTRIRIRHRSDVKPEWRVTWGSHTYDVEAVIPLEERGREVHLLCREVV